MCGTLAENLQAWVPVGMEQSLRPWLECTYDSPRNSASSVLSYPHQYTFIRMPSHEYVLTGFGLGT